MYCLLVVFPLVCCLLSIVVFFLSCRNFPWQVRNAMGATEMYQMREVYQCRSVHRHLDLRNEGYSLYNFVFGYFTMSTFFRTCHSVCFSTVGM